MTSHSAKPSSQISTITSFKQQKQQQQHKKKQSHSSKIFVQYSIQHTIIIKTGSKKSERPLRTFTYKHIYNHLFCHFNGVCAKKCMKKQQQTQIDS